MRRAKKAFNPESFLIPTLGDLLFTVDGSIFFFKARYSGELQNGINPKESRRNSIKSFRQPERKVRSFIGLTNYVGRHISHFSNACQRQIN